MPSLVIIDSECANLSSIYRATARAGLQPVISGDPDQITGAGAVIFPGVGSYAHAAQLLVKKGLDKVIMEVVSRGVPFLGICLGMQLLCSESEEAADKTIKGLDLIPGRVRRFPRGLPVPHVGWNQVVPLVEHPLFEGLPAGSYFYFTHSYYVDPCQSELTLSQTDYGFSFTSAIFKNNVLGVQFHPEKSGPAGLHLLGNFGKIIAEQRQK
ncbi:MAG: imidazole glycerol phosphate synthase subunit HisH [Bacillota bacterium]|nr:imidazole glycerol phosphate synthase subunit HisH [Bacillota bacterium]